MESSTGGGNDKPESPVKADKHFLAVQICLRFMSTATTLAASWLMLTSKQSVFLKDFGDIKVDASYSYSPAFKFFAYANIIASFFSVVSLFLGFIIGHKALNPKNHFLMFLLDLVVMTLLMAGCAAATAIGYVGKYGYTHAGWLAICDNFAKFCQKVTLSVTLSYLSFIFYFFLTITSANKSRQAQAY